MILTKQRTRHGDNLRILDTFVGVEEETRWQDWTTHNCTIIYSLLDLKLKAEKHCNKLGIWILKACTLLKWVNTLIIYNLEKLIELPVLT